MPFPEHCTMEQLAAALGRCQDEIIVEWRLQANELLRDRHLDKLAITNNLPFLIAAITRDLAANGGGSAARADIADNNPPHHGAMRFREGLDVGEVVSEYNLLRTAFTTVANRHGLSVADEAARIINHGIDEAVREAVMAFAEQQALMRKRQEDEHLAFIAHDLRTPLNAVSLLVEELKLGSDQSAGSDAENLFEVLGRNLQRVDLLIKRALDTQARTLVLGEALRPELRTFDHWPLVQRLILDLESVWSRREVRVVNEIPPGLTAFADAGLVEQVFQNILANAFEYTTRGRVVVSASEDLDTITCVVRDTGAGIPTEMLTKVFEKHVTDAAKEGTGIGLAIVKQIVEAHGGRAWAENGHGAGATISFTLPRTASDRYPTSGKSTQ